MNELEFLKSRVSHLENLLQRKRKAHAEIEEELASQRATLLSLAKASESLMNNLRRWRDNKIELYDQIIDAEMATAWTTLQFGLESFATAEKAKALKRISTLVEKPKEGKQMKRYWVSWWTGNFADEGCTEPPFQSWCSGYRDRTDDRDQESLCAVIDAENEEQIWQAIHKYFPDYEERFCELVEKDFEPSDRFPGFENRTSLKETV